MATVLGATNVDSATTSLSSDQSLNESPSCGNSENSCNNDSTKKSLDSNSNTTPKSCKISLEDSSRTNSYAGNKNVAEGLMDIALLSANANQLRFLITYNHEASTYFISLTLVAVSLIMQITVGIALIFKVNFKIRSFVSSPYIPAMPH